MVSSLGVWKDRFFWVSDEIVPFKLVWRHPDAVLNEPEPSALEINSPFLETLMECPSRLRPFPEHLLVLLGLSKLWDKPDRDPVLMRDGQGMHLSFMSALDLVKSDDTSDVVFGDVAVTLGEDAVVRGSEHRFEGSSYVNVPNVKGFMKAPGSKKLIKKNATPAIQGSSGKSVESLEEPEAERFMFQTGMLMLSSCNLSALLAEGVTLFTKSMQEYEEATKKKDKMKASMAAMKKEVGGFSKKEVGWVKKVGELTWRHAIEMNDLKKSFEADQLKLKEGLKASVAQATGDNQWLIEQGFHQVITYLLHSNEFNSTLGEVYTKLLKLGKHQGLIAGFKLHESGQALEQSPMFRPDASEVFKASVPQMERLTYPYVSQVANCFGKPLSVLQELNLASFTENVCAEVFDSLYKKRSRSRYNEETFSEDVDVSKEASLQGSTVGGDGGSKAKKAKGNGSGASKPPSDA
ncbi:hypothetical protein Hanom_Chr06g00556941 [Helianthus anomalus]